MSVDTRQIIDTIAARSDLDRGVTEKAVGTILSILRHEAGHDADGIFARVPGSAELAQAYDVMSPQASGQSEGLLGTLISSLGGGVGEKAGALINGLGQLKSTGLNMAQLHQAGSVLMKQLETAAGPAVIGNAMASVPGLRSHLGM